MVCHVSRSSKSQENGPFHCIVWQGLYLHVQREPQHEGTQRDHIPPARIGGHIGSIGVCVRSMGFRVGSMGVCVGSLWVRLGILDTNLLVKAERLDGHLASLV